MTATMTVTCSEKSKRRCEQGEAEKLKTIVIKKQTNKQTHHLRVLMMRGVSEATHIPVQNPKPDARVRKLQN